MTVSRKAAGSDRTTLGPLGPGASQDRLPSTAVTRGGRSAIEAPRSSHTAGSSAGNGWAWNLYYLYIYIMSYHIIISYSYHIHILVWTSGSHIISSMWRTGFRRVRPALHSSKAAARSVAVARTAVSATAPRDALWCCGMVWVCGFVPRFGAFQVFSESTWVSLVCSWSNLKDLTWWSPVRCFSPRRCGVHQSIVR